MRVSLEWGQRGATLRPGPAEGKTSPEAAVCAAAFEAVRGRLEALLLGCASGRELVGRGFAGDVVHAARLCAYDAVPVMRHGWLVSWSGHL